MYTFALLLLPVVLAFYFVQSEKKVNIILLITGSVTGFLVFALKEFLTLSHRIVPLSVGSNFAYLFFREAFLPIVILYGIFFLISKDDLHFKFDAFFPLVASFYCVFLPYNVATSPEAKTAFELLAKPLLTLCLLGSLSHGLILIKESINGKKILLVPAIALIIISFALPAFAEALFLTAAPVFSYTLITIFSLLLSGGSSFLTKIKI